jgi:hypothetical protein
VPEGWIQGAGILLAAHVVDMTTFIQNFEDAPHRVYMGILRYNTQQHILRLLLLASSHGVFILDETKGVSSLCRLLAFRPDDSNGPKPQI